MRPFSAIVGVGLFLAVVATAGAATLYVGPSRTYTQIQGAINVAHDGDLILVDSGTYVGRDGTMLFDGPHNITVRGVGPTRPLLDMGTDHSVSVWGKGICTVSGNSGDLTFENLEFYRAAGRDLAPWNDTGHNGAGVRYDGTGLLTMHNCYVHDCEEGMLTTSTLSYSVLIEYSEFNHNGYGNGSTHGVYLNHAESFTLRYSYMHRAHVGHEVKSRAKINYILYNRIMNEDGDASYEVDIPNGGLTYLIGNIIQQGPNATNGGIILYAEEGSGNGGLNPVQNLYVINNTVSNERGLSGTFVNNASSVAATLNNNLFLGSTEGTYDITLSGLGTVGTDNVLCNVNYNNGGTTHGPSAYLVSPGVPDYNYHLTAQSTAAIDKGVAPGSAGGFDLTPIYHYAQPCNYVLRPSDNALDIGAFEYSAGPSVRAGDSQTAREGDLVQLQAICDNPSGTATFSWSQVGGKAVTLSGGGTAAPSFTVPTVAVFPQATMLFQVTADNGLGTSSDFVDVRVYMLGDINRDDSVDVIDLLTFVAAFGSSVNDPTFDPTCDLNPDGTIDVIDLLTFIPNFGRTLD